MFKRPLLSIIFSSLIITAVLATSVFTNEHVQVSVFNKVIEPVYAASITPVMRINPDAYSFDPTEVTELEDNVRFGKYGEWSYCSYELPEEAEYNVNLLLAEVQTEVVAGEAFTVDMTFRNEGTARLFADHAECNFFPRFNVGTVNPMDRESVFGTEENAISGWASTQRIQMKEKFADPGDAFNVVWTSKAPGEHENDIYREFFQPVVEASIEDVGNAAPGWIDTMFAYDIEIGEPTEQMKDDILFVSDLAINAMSLDGLERNLESSLSEQMMYAKFGDIRVWSMPMSSGHYDTPTPRGKYDIFQKQELRIGGAWPHYHMPYWQYFGRGGYGIHGLPYLKKDGGTFWKEASSHMGIPVSHGCIRTLDRDAETLYRFTKIGTPLLVH